MTSKTKTKEIPETNDLKKRSRLSTTTSVLQKSATLEIAAKAKRMNAQGLNVISFSAGEPDFNTPENIKNAGKEAIDLNMTKYTDSSGTPELKSVIRQKFLRENYLHYDENNIIITNGAKYAIHTLLAAIVSPGEEVIVPAPYWVSYPSLVRLNGGIPVFCHAKEEFGFRLTLDDIKPVVTDKTKAIIINSPNNPTGAVYRLKDLEEIVNYLAERDIIIISDEIYEKIVYDNVQHIPLAGIAKEKHRRNIVVINGVSKSYAMTGWRIGYAAGPRDIIERMKYFLGHTTSNANSIAMHAAAEALSGKQNSLEMMVKKFDRRRRFMFDELNSIPHLVSAYPEGAFYIFTNFKYYINKKVNGVKINSSVDLVNYLLDEAHVAAVPGESFGMPGYMRFSYATSMDNIAEGMENLKLALADFE
ncbi:MAG: pyridoxal phosphate-dependent aminotransferase [bacterium]